MTGTRLAIQATAVIQSAVLASVALWYGLCGNHDVFCRPFIDQEGRAALELLQIQNTPITVFPIDVLVPSIDEENWKLRWNGYRGDSFRVFSDDDKLKELCSTRISRPVDVLVAVCVSPDNEIIDSSEATFVFANGTGPNGTFLDGDYMQVIDSVIPARNENEILRKRLSFTLQIEDSSTADWSMWTRAVQRWMEQARIMDLPLWRKHVILNHKFGFERGELAKQITTYNGAIAFMDHIFEYDPSLSEILLFVPNKIPITGSKQDSKVEREFHFRGTKFVSFPHVLPMRNNETDHYKSVSDAMAFYFVFIQEYVMGLGSPIEGIDTLPQWLLDLYMQRVLRETHDTFVKKAITLRQQILGSGSDISIPVEMVETFKAALTSKEEAIATLRAMDGSRNRAAEVAVLAQLEEALDLLTEIETDHVLVPPLSFPIDQLTAVFAPLLFPLIIPMIAGLRREYKRFCSRRRTRTIVAHAIGVKRS